jgi:hypothetical protein
MFTACQQAPGVDSSQMFVQRNVTNPINQQTEKLHVEIPDCEDLLSDESETFPFTKDEMM